jgi:phage shock protein A
MTIPSNWAWGGALLIQCNRGTHVTTRKGGVCGCKRATCLYLADFVIQHCKHISLFQRWREATSSTCLSGKHATCRFISNTSLSSSVTYSSLANCAVQKNVSERTSIISASSPHNQRMVAAAHAPAFVAPVGGVSALTSARAGAFTASATSPLCRATAASPTVQAPTSAPRRVSPSMNIFDRFFRVVRANINKALSSVEDPEKLLDQTVADMQGDVVKVRQAYAEVSAGLKRLERQSEQAVTTSSEWKKRAQMALQKGEEGLAREALTRKKAADDQAAVLASQIQVMRANTEKLFSSMQALESKIQEARSKKDEYIARARTAATSQKVNDMLGNVSGSGALEAFERMKVKVEELEVKADVSRDMMVGGAADSSLENKFRALESDSVDDELAKLKGAMGMGNTPFSLPSRTSTPELDEEIERMKREM